MDVQNSSTLVFRPVVGGSWRGAAGDVTVARPTPGVIVITMRGRVEVPGGDVIYSAVSRELEREPASTYWDLWDMTYYHSDVRGRATAVLLEKSSRIPSIHATAQSKIVLMGVSVANLALGGRVTSHGTYAEFTAALAKVGARP